MQEERSNSKYMLLYLKTGGGHLAPAKSIAKYLDKNYGDCSEIILVDGLLKAPKLSKFLVEDGYRILQNRAKWYFEMLYAFNKIIGFAKWNALLISRIVKPYLKEMILSEKPDKIVVLHFFLVKPVYEILKENNITIPVITIVTDPFTAPPIWFLNKKEEIIVFSERVKEYAVKRNIPAEKIHVFPFILDEKFNSPIPENELRGIKERLGFNPDKKLILILGGGDGIPKGELILKKIMKEIDYAETAIVCGRNKQLFSFANKLKAKGNYYNLKVFGFIDFVYELLNISDVVITKCGASTFMEILHTRKIPVVNNYIWEQEKGNVEYIVDNKLGIFERRVSKIPGILTNLLLNQEVYNSYINNIKKEKLVNGTAEVGEFLKNL